MTNKYVIYTVIVGNYDVIKQPLVTDERFDYVLFTDNVSNSKIGIWQVRSIPYKDSNLLRLSRYPKLHPCKVLSEYEASLYIDGTLQIATPYVYSRFIELVSKNIEWGGICHYHRDCIYEEMQEIVGCFMRGTHDYEAIEWYCKLKKEGFPRHYGLYENNCIFRLHTQNVQIIGDEWWATLNKLCKRDQFSLMYLLWKNPVTRDFFLDKSVDAKHTEHFVYTVHHAPRPEVIKGFHERIRYDCWRRSPDGWRCYGYILERASTFPIAKYALLYWELKSWLKYVVYLGTKHKIWTLIHHQKK